MKFSQKTRSFAKHKPVLLLIYALIFSTVGYIIVRSFAATPPNAPSMYLTPSAQTLPVSTTFTVAIHENSGTTGINAAQAVLNYPSNLLSFVSIDYTNSAFDTSAPSSGATAGTLTIARGNTVNLTGDHILASVTFRTSTTSGAAAMVFANGTQLLNPNTSSTSVDILGGLASTAGGTYTVDATAPTVSVSTPANGAVISAGTTTNVTATATDNSSVSGVDIIIDGTTKATLTTSPYTYSWNTTGLSLGSHTIQAKASDPYGNSATSTLSTVTLADTTAPTVSISAPAANANVAATTTITASAADNSGGTGISKVEFYVDGTLKNTDTSSPYSYAWDTKTTTDGNHSLTAKAYDSAATPNSTTSAAVTVKVNNTDTTAPTTPGSLAASKTTATAITLTWTASTDNVAVNGYRVQRNGTTITTTSGTTLTYIDSGLASSTSFNYSVAAVDAAGNVSTAATVTAKTLPAITGDFDGSGTVGILDLSIMLNNWLLPGRTYFQGDLDGNGTVNILDLSILLNNWTF